MQFQNRNLMLKLFNSIFLFCLTSGRHSVILVSVHPSIPIIIKLNLFKRLTHGPKERCRYGNSNAKFYVGKYKRRYKIKLETRYSGEPSGPLVFLYFLIQSLGGSKQCSKLEKVPSKTRDLLYQLSFLWNAYISAVNNFTVPVSMYNLL